MDYDSETKDEFDAQLEEWKSAQKKILSWFNNIFVPFINIVLPSIDTTKAAWDFLANRYKYTNDSALEFQLEFKI